jgi:hypothetical protein
VRVFEYIPWLLVTFGSLFVATAVMPRSWPESVRQVFRIIVAVTFFFLIGAYWLATGEKFDETAYRLVLCKMHSFERCTPGEPKVWSNPSLNDPTNLEQLRRRQEQNDEEAAQRKQVRQDALRPQPAERPKAGATSKKPLCVTFNDQQICE